MRSRFPAARAWEERSNSRGGTLYTSNILVTSDCEVEMTRDSYFTPSKSGGSAWRACFPLSVLGVFHPLME